MEIPRNRRWLLGLCAVLSAGISCVAWFGCTSEKLVLECEQCGTVIGFQHNPNAYDLKGDVASEIKQWDHRFHPGLFCSGPGDTLIIGSSSLPNGEMPDDFRMYFYKWLPWESSLVAIESIGTSKSWCVSLDYNSEDRLYVLFGQQEDKEGVYLLDSSFTLISEIPLPRETLHCEGSIRRGYLLKGGRLAILCRDVVYLIEEGEVQTLSRRGSLLAKNRSGTRLVYDLVSAGGDSATAYVYDVETKESIKIETGGRDIMACAFSPDERYLVYNHRAGLLGDAGKMRVCDLEEKTDHGTRFYSIGGLVWIATEPDEALMSSDQDK